MTRGAFIEIKLDEVAAFNQVMRDHLPEGAEVSKKGWHSLYDTFVMLSKVGTPHKAILAALKGLTGGWWSDEVIKHG